MITKLLVFISPLLLPFLYQYKLDLHFVQHGICCYNDEVFSNHVHWYMIIIDVSFIETYSNDRNFSY